MARVTDVFIASYKHNCALNRSGPVTAGERLTSRAGQGDRARFLEVLAKVPDVEPEERDRFGKL